MIDMLMNPEYIAGFFAVLFALFAVAAAITKLTPSPDDDKMVAKFYKIAVKLGSFVGAKPPKKK